MTTSADPRSDSAKLPVPAPWQRAVRAVLVKHGQDTGLPAEATAVTRVEPERWTDGEGRVAGDGLSVWLISRGRTHRYRATFDGSVVENR